MEDPAVTTQILIAGARREGAPTHIAAAFAGALASPMAEESLTLVTPEDQAEYNEVLEDDED